MGQHHRRQDCWETYSVVTREEDIHPIMGKKGPRLNNPSWTRSLLLPIRKGYVLRRHNRKKSLACIRVPSPSPEVGPRHRLNQSSTIEITGVGYSQRRTQWLLPRTRDVLYRKPLGSPACHGHGDNDEEGSGLGQSTDNARCRPAHPKGATV